VDAEETLWDGRSNRNKPAAAATYATGTMTLFTRAEFLARLSKTRARMAERGLDLLFVTVPENIFYLTGYSGWSFYTVQGLIVSPEREEPILVVRDMDVACVQLSAFLSPDSIVGYPEEYIGGEKHPMTFIVQTIRERCGAPRRIGIEANGAFFAVSAHRRLAAALPDSELVDADGLVNWLRSVKSPAEIAIMRQAADLSSLAIETAHRMIEPGVRECDVTAELFKVLIQGTAKYGGSVPSTVALAAGERTSAPHLEWTDETFKPDTAVNLELGGSRHQYHAGLSRSWYLGEPPPSLTRLSAVVVEGLNTALEAVKPGTLCEDVEAAWRRVIARAGYEKASRIGYTIGIGFQPSWIEETASLQAGDRTPLEPGMTFHMICGMWKGTDNIVLSETFLVTPQGHDVLTRAPRALLVKR
jgi:ectoine hydrolase